MKKLITVILVIFSLTAFGQRSVTGDTLKIYGGGSFGGSVSLDSLLLNLGGQIYYQRSSGDTLFLNADTLYKSGVSYWTKSGNYVFPTTLTDSVGIWKNDPLYQLDVKGSAKFERLRLINHATYADSIETTLTNSATNIPLSSAVFAAIGEKSNVSVTNQSNNRVLTSTATTDVMNAEALLYFDASTSRLGIGTAAPSGALEVMSNSSEGVVTLRRNSVVNGEYTGLDFKISPIDGDTYKKGAIFYERKTSYYDGILHFAMDGTADTSNADLDDSKMAILTNGNVGIGTTTPTEALHVTGNQRLTFASSDWLMSERGTGGTITYQNQISGQAGNAEFFTKDGDGTDNVLFGMYGVGTPADIATAKERLLFGWLPSAGQYIVWSDASGTGTQRPLVLDAYNSSVASLNQLVLDTTGNIGIGTTSPNALLSVGSGIHETATFSVRGENSGTIANFRDKDGENVFKTSGSLSDGNLSVKFGDMDYAYNGNYFTVTDSKTYFMNGNVGIGTTTPTAALDVVGKIEASAATHLFHYFGDSTITLTYSTSWQHLTNKGFDMWIDAETDGFTISNDTIAVTGAGDYNFTASNTLSIDNGETFSVRFYNVTQGRVIPVASASTGRGSGNYNTLITIAYADINAGDKIVIQYAGSANGTAVFKNGLINITKLHH